jgi:hypothetical protein
MRRIVALAKAAFAGAFLAGLFGMAVVILIGTACIALGVPSVHLAAGPIPFMTAYSGNEYGFSSDWGVWLVAPLGAIVAMATELRRRPRAA